MRDGHNCKLTNTGEHTYSDLFRMGMYFIKHIYSNKNVSCNKREFLLLGPFGNSI